MPILTIYTYLFFLLILYYVINIHQKNDDIFSPKSFFIIFTLFEIPYAFKIIDNLDLIPYYAKIHIKDFSEVYFIHFFNSSLFIIFVIVSLAIFNPRPKYLYNLLKDSDNSHRINLLTHLSLLLLCFLGYYLFLNSIGGLFYLLQNIDSKSTIIAGTGYYQAIYYTAGFLSVGYLVIAFSQSNKSLIKKIYLVVIILSIFLIFTSIGSRKTPILFILFTFLIWNYHINKVKIFTTKNIIFGFIGLIYFSAMPLFRAQGAFEYYSNNLDILFIDSFEKLFNFFERFSELDRSLMIYSIFDSSNYWLGTSFKDILYAPIPRSMFPDKPPLDEGVYIYNIAHGNIVSPTTSLLKMTAVGWPPNTITNMYINFGYIGVPIGGLIFGYFLKYFYNLVVHLNYNPIGMYLYSSAIFGSLALTNRNIVSFLTMIVFSIIIVKSIQFITRIRF
ncbi:O-antigen polymerase [Arcobacter sp. YIC-464]|uniref:O-antigen polymerase n=1 Tax=Arcobacter sp. YIC-464 TaxID=3376631 RepID=UPI003C16C624